MPDAWIKTTLGKHIELTTGPVFESKKFTYSPQSGMRLARGDNIKEGKFEWGEKSRYWPDMTDELKPFLLQEGDVLVGMDGSKVGKNWVRVTSANLPCLLVQRVACLRAHSGLDQRYLRYLIGNVSFSRYIDAIHTGTSIPHISGGQIRSLPILLPPLSEQRAIAYILGTIDDKIELNQRLNETLEAMAQALFKSWFVDFDPVRVKAEGSDIGLPKEIMDIFPNSLEDSELGTIPKGWQVATLSDVCQNIYSGGTPSTVNPDFWNGDIPWLSSGETRSRFIIRTEKTITLLGVTNSSTRLAKSGSTVIACAGQGHTRGQTSLLMIDSYINQSIIALTADPRVISGLYLYFDLSRRYQQFRQISDSHSSRGSLTTKDLAQLQILIPPPNLVSKFNQYVGPFIEQIYRNLSELLSLTVIRDALLPKLISGELRIPDAERFMEDYLDEQTA